MSTPQTAIASSLTDALEETKNNDNKFLTFRLGQEEYGVQILNGREIIVHADFCFGLFLL